MRLKKLILVLLASILLAGCLAQLPLCIAIALFCFAQISAYLALKLNQFIVRETEPPSLLSDPRRNFDYILLGSTYIWGQFRVANNSELNGGMCFAKPLQSLWSDYLVLQHMHSYLKPSGTVILTVDLECQMDLISKKLNYASLKMLHSVTLESLGKRLGSLQRSYPILFFPNYSSVLLFNYTRFRWCHRLLGNKNRTYKLNFQRNEGLMKASVEIIKSVEDFCVLRSLELKVIFLSSETEVLDNSNDIFQPLREICSDFYVARNHVEIRQLLR